MKKQLLVFGFKLFVTFHVIAQTPQGCDIAAIRAAFAAAGHYTELSVPGQPCSMYFIDNNSYDAATAESNANALGAHTIVFNDATENTNVINALNAGGYLSGGATVWIGVKRVSTGNPLFYMLDGTSGPFTPGPSTPGLYQNWAPGEPNNNDYQCSPGCLVGCNSYKCNNGEQCVQIYSSGQWNDLPCDESSKSVIEVNLCPELTVSNDTIVCSGGAAPLKAKTILGSSPITQVWNPGNLTGGFQIFYPTTPTDYFITATDRYGCFDKDTIHIGINTGCNAPPAPKGCDIQAIRNAFAAAGHYTELPVLGQACSMYFVDNNSYDAATAESNANTLGAHMVFFNDAAENSNVESALTAGGYLPGTVWVGVKRVSNGNSLFYALDGSTGSFTPGGPTPSLYQNWAGSEPNNNTPGCCTSIFGNICTDPDDNYTCANGEQCVQMYQGGQWNDLPCNRSSKSVIEVNLCPQLRGTANDTLMCDPGPINITTNTILGSTPYTFSWTPGSQTTPNITVTPPIGTTNYIARATDRYGCYGEDTTVAQVISITPPTITGSITPPSICVGQTIDVDFWNVYSSTAVQNWYLDGATLNGSSTVLPYRLSWTTPGVKNVSLYVTDFTCTTTTTTFPITVNPSPTPTAGPDLPVCSGVNANLGGPAAANTTYYWTPTIGLSSSAIADPVFNLVNPGDTDLYYPYVVVATSNGCIGVDTAYITLHPPVTNTFRLSRSAICSIETDSVIYTGTNSASATYNWNFDGGTIVSGSGQGPYVVQWNTAGTKMITLDITENGCTGSQGSQTLVVTQQPTANAGPDLQICSGENANLGVAAVTGVSYSWTPTAGLSSSVVSNPTFNLVNLGSTTLTYPYVLTASENSCVSLDTAILTLYPPIVNTFSVSKSAICSIEMDTITYTGTNSAGATYNWSFDGGTVVTGSGQGPYVIQWNSGGVKTITLSITENGCTSASGSQTVTVTQQPVANAGVDVSVCPNVDANLGLAPIGTTTYAWNPATFLSSVSISNPVFNGTNTTNSSIVQSYILSATEGQCVSLDTVVVTLYNTPTSSFTASPTNLCVSQQSTTLTYTGNASASATYTWNFDGGTNTGNGQGPIGVLWNTVGAKNVTLDVSQNGCPSTSSSVTINVGNPPTVDAGPDQSICSGGTVAIGSNPISGYTYQWNTQAVINDSTIANPNFSYLNTGTIAQTFTLTVTANDNGCQASDDVVVTVSVPQSCTIIANDPTTFCDGGSATLTCNDPSIVSWLWSTSATTQTITVNASGTYSMNGYDINNCYYSSNAITINEVPNPQVGLSGVGIVDESCSNYKDGSITVLATSGTPNYQYVWNTTPSQTAATITNLEPGTYDVLVTDQNGCTVTASYTVNTANVFYVVVDSVHHASCFGFHDGGIFASVVGGYSPYIYLWSNGSTQQDLKHIGAGNYSVTATDGHGCKNDMPVSIGEPAEITASTHSDLNIDFNEETDIDVTVTPSGSYTYVWSPAASLSCADCEDPHAAPVRTTTYTLIVTDQNTLCNDTTQIELIVDPSKRVYIPNAFTPNNDTKNDEWFVFTSGVKYFSVAVFNRWGEKVFETSDIKEGWNGTFKGAPVQPGIYTYNVNITFLDGEVVKNKGSITVLK